MGTKGKHWKIDYRTLDTVKYNHDYYLAHKEHNIEMSKQYRLRNQEARASTFKKYSQRFLTTGFLKYLGVQTCPKCGCKGYPSLRAQRNNSTNVIYRSFIEFTHKKRVTGKTVFDYSCRIGQSERELFEKISGLEVVEKWV